MSTLPLVTCIMPTRDRPHFARQAIAYFQRQDYPNRELLILDDGCEPIANLIPCDPRIRYIRMPGRIRLGAKRNLACREARGELIAHWDDDDWIAPDRLSLQVDSLLDSGAQVTGADSLLYYCPSSAAAWRYRPLASDCNWVAGGTLLYRQSAWEQSPFPEIETGEDTAFVQRMPSNQIQSVNLAPFYVAVIHAGNSSAKHSADPRWKRIPLEEVTSLLGEDNGFYVTLRGGRHPGPPALPSNSKTITLAASFLVHDGYGSMAEYMALGMHRAGADVRIAAMDCDPQGLTSEMKALLGGEEPDPSAPVLYFSWPHTGIARYLTNPELVVNTMWESSRLPAAWTPILNKARLVVVPTHFVADVCRKSGVNRPIEVIPEGIDPDVYRFETREERPGITTLIVGTYIERKNVRQGIEGWKIAFAGNPDARLIIKSRFRCGSFVPDDPRIIFVDEDEPTRGIAHWYRQADVLLALGNEGFGLPLVEGMATGLPVVALNSEGQADVCKDAAGLVLTVSPETYTRYSEAPYGECGVRGKPSVEDIAGELRWVSEHRDEARDMGRAASSWARANRNVWRKGPAILEAMERHLAPRRLRCSTTFWTPSWNTPCGISEYTRHLSDELPGVAVTAQPPELDSGAVLHVQHINCLFNRIDLPAVLRSATARGLKSVVTEHAVEKEGAAWENLPDALVALTSVGALRLSKRHPSKRVEYLPHGCPTWFPPRKRRRGCVIGAFGFPGPHKGFGKLLDVIRAIPKAELVVFSHSQDGRTNEAWNRDAAALRVRLCGDYLPPEQVAERLAAEADILIFWYDEVAAASASGAVRIGLASGVPVLASPTTWFEDIAGATYQPTDLIEGVRRLFEDTPMRGRITAAAKDLCFENSWARSAERHRALWRSL